ncbi:PTS mannose/fructose/sorbose/N-acetylgalactosamine transporter subunit IIC [Clostridium sp. MB05]|jgi:fructoselysine/glucoselysine PTS system EIIC component
MSLGFQAILIGLVAFFGYFHNYAGSTMWNRPIIMATLTGLVLGDIKTGIMVGAALELAFLGAVPIGASNPPDMTAGSIIGTAFVIISNAQIGAAIALAIPVATLALLFNNLLMMFVLVWVAHLADKYAEEGNASKVEWLCRISAIGNMIVLAFVVAISFYVGVPVIENVLAMIPEWIIHGMDVAAGILPAVGFAMLAKMIVTKELVAFLILGFLLTAYLKIPVFGVALLGLVIALIAFYTRDNKSGNIEEAYVDENEF